MSQVQDIKVFTGKMDKDSPHELIAEGDYLELRNCRNEFGFVENIKGTTQIDDYSEGYTCVGSVFDRKRDWIIYFIKDGTGTDNILRAWDEENSVAFNIISSAYLAFSDSIINPQIIDDLLIWIDDGILKQLDIVKAYNYTTSTAGKTYVSIDADTFNFIKKPPLETIGDVTFGYDGDVKTNNLIKKCFQFCYRYVYRDYSKSVKSPVSKLQFLNQESPYGKYTAGANNYMEFDMPIGTIEVEKIELLVRNNNTDDWSFYDAITKGAITNDVDITITAWTYTAGVISAITPETTVFNQIFVGQKLYIYDSNYTEYHYTTVSKIDSTNHTFTVKKTDLATQTNTGPETSILHAEARYHFTNNKNYLGIDQTDLGRAFDYVPTSVGVLEAFENTRLCVGNYTEGRDLVDLDVSMSYGTTDVTLADYKYILTGALVGQVMSWYRFGFCVYPAGPPSLFSGYVYNFYIDLKSICFAFQVYNTTSTLSEFLALVERTVNTHKEYYNGNIKYTASPTPGYFFIDIYNPALPATQYYNVLRDGNKVTYGGYIIANPPKYTSYKINSTHKFGIEYLDEFGRSGGINTDSLCEVTIPTYKQFADAGKANVYFKTYLTMSINHTPPDWAYYYKIVYQKNTPNFRRFSMSNYKNWWRFDELGNIRIKINRYIELFNETYHNSQIPNYSYTSGDRLKLIALYNQTSSVYTFYADTYDVPVLGEGYDEDDLYNDSDDVLVEDYSNYEVIIPHFTTDIINTSTASLNILFEIYNPIKQEFYYEIGEVWSILFPTLATRLHNGDTPQTASTAALVTLDGGDVYLKMQVLPRFWHVIESDAISDFWSSKSVSIGFPNVYVPEMREVEYPARLRWGGKFMEDTQSNYLFKFSGLDYQDLPNKFKEVQFIKEIGDTLKVLFRNNEVSHYIGKEEITFDSEKKLIASSRVLSNYYSYPTEYGTYWPKSVLRHDRDLYYVDTDRHAIIRSSVNGQTDITINGMKSWMRAKSILINASPSSYDIMTVYDNKRGEVWFIFCDNSGGSEAIIFNESKNGFTLILDFFVNTSYHPERIISSLHTIYSFYDADLYSHESAATYNLFWDSQRDMTIKTISNKEPLMIKIFKGIGLETNYNKVVAANKGYAWHCDELTTPLDGQITSGQETEIPYNYFKRKERTYFAPILRDKNTPNKKGTKALLCGRVIRGKYCDVELSNSNVNYVTLKSIIIGSDISETNQI